VPKTPKSGAGLERNQVPLSAEITCRFRPKSGAGLLRFLHALSPRRRVLPLWQPDDTGRYRRRHHLADDPAEVLATPECAACTALPALLRAGREIKMLRAIWPRGRWKLTHDRNARGRAVRR
jgi:hypothetical protein